jgi:asparagine synthase (glutamine-hydrolysing)
VDDDSLQESLPVLLEAQDEPLADWTAIPQHFVSQLARDTGTIVVQVGEGADELFHGYQGYVDHRRVVAPLQRWLPRAAGRPLGSLAVRATTRLGRGVRHGEALYDASRSAIPYWGGALCFRGPLKERLLTSAHEGHLPAVERIWAEAEGADLFQHMSYLELRQRLPELLLMRMDRIAMASSVEGREPFLDHELVELVMALPPEMKYRDGHGKHVLREAMRGALPSEILDRPKQGFGSPMEEWMRGPFGHEAEAAVRGSALAGRGLLDYDLVSDLFAAHRRGRGDWSKHLWNLYVVSRWYDRWIA